MYIIYISEVANRFLGEFLLIATLYFPLAIFCLLTSSLLSKQLLNYVGYFDTLQIQAVIKHN